MAVGKPGGTLQLNEYGHLIVADNPRLPAGVGEVVVGDANAAGFALAVSLEEGRGLSGAGQPFSDDVQFIVATTHQTDRVRVPLRMRRAAT